MSDIRINPIQDKTLLILKRIQNKLSLYRGYKQGGDLVVPTRIIYDEIMKRASISLSNLRAAIDNLESYGRDAEKKMGEELYSRIDGLRQLKISFPEKQILVNQPDIEKFYSEDDVGFSNAVELLDNVNSFRSASISGDFDQGVYNKINENINNIKNYIENRKAIIEGS